MRSVLIVVALVIGCGDKAGTAGPLPSRVVAVRAAEPEGESPDTFCEVHGGDTDFAWPQPAETAIEGETPGATQGWRWINVWATWCRPCIEEMPRLAGFQERLAAEGTNVELIFVSADSEASAVEQFHEAHPDHPTGPRVPETDVLRTWLGGFGLDEGAPLPVHLFVSPDGKVACARTAAIGDDDYESVKRLLDS